MSGDCAKLKNNLNLLIASCEDMKENYRQLLIVNNILEEEVKVVEEKAENHGIKSLTKMTWPLKSF